MIGPILASVIQILTQYFTDTKYTPVQEIAESTVTGPATTISGFSIGLESTCGPCRSSPARSWGPSTSAIRSRSAVLHLAHRHGDAHDRGRGRLDGHVRARVRQRAGDRGDVGRVRGPPGRDPGRPGRRRNSTKAITKGLAIATAVLAATSLFGSFEEALRVAGLDVQSFEHRRTGRPRRAAPGGSVAFLFSSLAIRAVGRAAMQVVVEVRNQFRDHPGIMDFTEKPDYGRRRHLHADVAPGADDARLLPSPRP